jgi:hypothetical protein
MREPYYVLFLRAAGAEAYTNEAGSPDKAALMAEANRALMRGVASAIVARIEFWESASTQGQRDPQDW